jgi:tRNA (guanine-N7-)-methyltransferase
MAGTPLPLPPSMPARTFHPRRGRMGVQKQAALIELLPRYEWVADRDPLPPGPLMVEIGFGMGRATIGFARAHPQATWLAFDIHTPGVANLCRLLHEGGITNVRICADDALEVLYARIPSASLDAVVALFPDPWPKIRHHFRRLVQQPFLDLAADRLRPGGLLHLATDWDDYARQMTELVSAHRAFERVDAPPREHTKFELAGIAAGRTITDVAARRR